MLIKCQNAFISVCFQLDGNSMWSSYRTTAPPAVVPLHLIFVLCKFVLKIMNKIKWNVLILPK